MSVISFTELLVAGIFGAIIGSFLNALSYRFNTGRGMGGRSYCDRCGQTLGVGDLVPILSFIFLRGRCRYCRAKISIQNLLVEVVAALLSIMVYVTYPVLNEGGIMFSGLAVYFFWLIVWMLLLFIIVYDIRHTIIPWSCSGLLAVLTFASLFFSSITHVFFMPSLWALLAGPLLALPLFLISLVSGGRWMGWGDSALELSLGWMLGLSLGGSALMYGFWSGALIGVGLLLFSKIPWIQSSSRFTIQSEIPFAPFLVFGACLAYFFHVDLFSSLSLLW